MATIEKEKALDVVRQMVADGQVSQEVSEKYFPELAGSEDEKIRKGIIRNLEYLADRAEGFVKDELKERIAWLEKQGEPTDKIEPKFHVGDWVIVSTTKGDKVVQIASVEHFKDDYPSYITTEGRWFGNGTKARLLTYKDVETITLPESRVIVNQKPSWSEEDERNLNDAILFIKTGTYSLDKDNLINWLKSLRPQKQWKPSEEQIKTYKEVYADILSAKGFDLGTINSDLNRLEEELKKLKE